MMHLLRNGVGLLVILIVSYFSSVESHGRMELPAARNAAWRHGFKVPANYNDLELNCGGVGQQHGKFAGKCGVCGDSLGAPVREHEVGGKYATGTIVKTYQNGQWIDIDIILSANHLGFMQFRLCATNSPLIDATQECLDQNVLEIRGYGDKYPVKRGESKINLSVKLPDGFACSHCVLQWKYRAGNNWGTENGVSGLGIGPQETFINCADIQIRNDGGIVTDWTPTLTTSQLPSTAVEPSPTETPSSTRPIIVTIRTKPPSTITTKPMIKTTSKVKPVILTTTTDDIYDDLITYDYESPIIKTTTTTPLETTENQYIYHGKITCNSGFDSLDKFCYENCATPEKTCPENICHCIWTE